MNGGGLSLQILHHQDGALAVFGASAPVVAWATTTVAGAMGVCVRFSSFNLERSERLTYLASLNLVGSSGWPGNRLGVSPAVAWR